MEIVYRRTGEAWADFDRKVEQFILDQKCKDICDIGGGANPVLPLDFIQANGLNYVLLDILQSELDKAPDGYGKVVADIAGKSIETPTEAYDFMFSKMLAEHVRDGEQFHRNVFKLLKPGGYALHFFPTLFAFPFVLNRIFPETFTRKLLSILNPDRLKGGQHEKFPALYSWTFGPTKRQIERLESTGLEIVEYTCHYGHEGYYRRIPPIKALHNAGANFLMKQKSPTFTSYAYILLRRPN